MPFSGDIFNGFCADLKTGFGFGFILFSLVPWLLTIFFLYSPPGKPESFEPSLQSNALSLQCISTFVASIATTALFPPPAPPHWRTHCHLLQCTSTFVASTATSALFPPAPPQWHTHWHHCTSTHCWAPEPLFLPPPGSISLQRHS